MTSEGFGEMFEGDCRHVCRKISAHADGGDERTVKRVQTVSEDPHRGERN